MAFLASDEVFDWSIQMGAGGNAPIEQQQQQPQRRLHQQQQPTLIRCPRCDSSNTKFCYYNNYNRSQPRHFCRDCRRHWTVGGTLRSVPVGGARKNNNNNNKSKRTTKTTATSNTTITQPGAVQFNVSGNYMDESIDIYRHEFTFYNAPVPPPLSSSDQGGSMISSFATNVDQGIVINPLPVSATGDTAGILDLMPGGSSTSGTWIQDLTPLPTTYYNSTWWDDSTLHFVNSPAGLEQYPAPAAAADGQLRPGVDV